jgi:hypothetical protein
MRFDERKGGWQAFRGMGLSDFDVSDAASLVIFKGAISVIYFYGLSCSKSQRR